MQLEIRNERPDDVEAICAVNRRAFGQDQEADLVDALRAAGAVLVSLVAIANGRVVGHILYSPASIAGVRGAALGPMSVLPEYQRQGIGGKLVQSGNRKLETAGCPFIIVVGHPEFYPRFGFAPAKVRGITCEWNVPDSVFMIAVLDEQQMVGVRGLATYRREFADVS
jgi:putative acetyltransferase